MTAAAAPKSAAAMAAATTPAIGQNQGAVVENVDIKKIAQYVKEFRNSRVAANEDTMSECSDGETTSMQSIIRKQFHKRMRNEFQLHKGNADYFLNAYETLMSVGADRSVVGDGAGVENLMPAVICRLILLAKDHITNWTNLNRAMNNPYRISDQRLAEIVTECLWKDITDGACAHIRQLTMAEDYRGMLKRFHKEPNIPFDEARDKEAGDADEVGKKAAKEAVKSKSFVAVLSDKEKIVPWIESTGSHRFGDNSHQKRFKKRELTNFTKRDGSGVHIYWLGHNSETPTVRKKNRIFHVEDFPDSGELVIAHISRTPQSNKPPPMANGARGDNAGGLDMPEYESIVEEGLRLLGL